MSDINYFIKMHENQSIRELIDNYEEETEILHDIMGYDYYDDKGRQLSVQRNHIEAIKILIDRNR